MILVGPRGTDDLVIRRARLRKTTVDVRIDRGVIAAIGERLDAGSLRRAEQVDRFVRGEVHQVQGLRCIPGK